jgi:hypothetical protein
MEMRTDQISRPERQGDGDARGSVRQPFRVPIRATIYPPIGQESDTARYSHVLAQDLSLTGISFIYPRRLLNGQEVEFETPEWRRSAVVCRVDRLKNGLFLMGCRFVESLPSLSSSSVKSGA